MPFDLELDESRRIVLSRAWGQLTDEDLLSHLQRVAEGFQRGLLDARWAQIADFSDVENLDRVSTSGVRQMAVRNPWPKESPRVLIVPSDVQYGLARMYRVMGEPQTTRLALARSGDEAMACIEKARDSSSEVT